MGKLIGDRVLLLGGSMAALLAARVLSEHYREVVMVERDEVRGVRQTRRGVPHGGHAHGLIARGQQIFEQHFPGLTEELRVAGVVPGDVNEDIRWYFNGRQLRKAVSGLVSVPATRPVLEFHLRERVLKIPNVVLRERHDVLGLVFSDDDSRVTGARVRAHDAFTDEVIDTDLVIDVTGRGSRTPPWLAEHGYDRPGEDKVKIGLAYTTQHFQLQSDPFGDDIAIIPVATPSHPRGGFFYRLPGDDNRVELSLTGVLGDHPPTDQEGFLAFARSLPVPEVYAAIRDAEPVDQPIMFGFPASVRKRYDRLTRFPQGYLVMGDAVCSFNPVYGQGMTVAALESLTLRRHLQRGHEPRPLEFFADISRDIDAPWEVSAGADLGYPEVPGHRSLKTRVANAYMAKVQAAAVHDGEVTNAFFRTAGLIDPPQRLFRPSTVLKVLRNAGRREQPGPQAPTAVLDPSA
ncbi:NAD(P)/FAD-dependent oxidoreductase [Catellatospora methionotrophica]|uniref:NAD(P)/FAD-dependent oxidoreductase n=1 Tax=Catellatospora methionotrophica TaxID=121620 RepID=UPI0033D7DFDE